jgi:hypothetical protein
MSSLPKGESMGTKLVELFANQVVERRNMTMSIQGESLQGEFCDFELFLALLCHFAWLATFLFICWLLQNFPLLVNLLELFLSFLVF